MVGSAVAGPNADEAVPGGGGYAAASSRHPVLSLHYLPKQTNKKNVLTRAAGPIYFLCLLLF